MGGAKRFDFGARDADGGTPLYVRADDYEALDAAATALGNEVQRLQSAYDHRCSVIDLGAIRQRDAMWVPKVWGNGCSYGINILAPAVRDGQTQMVIDRRVLLAENDWLHALIQNAVNPHAFNCGWIKHQEFTKMVPTGGCTCGVGGLTKPSAKCPVCGGDHGPPTCCPA